MIIKINKAQGRAIVAICDSNLLGKNFENDISQLDLSSPFYLGKESTTDQVIEMFNKADNLNLVGEKTIRLALDNKILTNNNIRMIQNIPYAIISNS